jgi:ketosteroid isomerase-like protein
MEDDVRLTRIVAAVVLCGTTACATTDSARPAGAAIEGANGNFEASARARDLEKLIRSYYSKQPIISFGGRTPTRGLEGARAAWKELLDKGTISLETRQLETACDLASELGEWSLIVQPDEGDKRSERGVYQVTWRRTDGQWKVVMQTLVVGKGGFGEVQ